jgi:hypothetical protein
MPLIEPKYHTQLQQIGGILYALSFGLGFYYTYPLTMWIDSKLRFNDFHIWLKRIVSGIMVMVGLFLLANVALSSVILTFSNFYKLAGISYSSFFSLVAGFAIGLIVFSSYMTFRYMRESGYIIYTR